MGCGFETAVAICCSAFTAVAQAPGTPPVGPAAAAVSSGPHPPSSVSQHMQAVAASQWSGLGAVYGMDGRMDASALELVVKQCLSCGGQLLGLRVAALLAL
jgi:hypothetical protein